MFRFTYIGFALMGLPGQLAGDLGAWAGLLLHGPGINCQATNALAPYGVNLALEAGFARGQHTGNMHSLRCLASFLAPLLYAQAYKWAVGSVQGRKSPGLLVGIPWLLVATFGALIPELLHRSLKDSDIEI